MVSDFTMENVISNDNNSIDGGQQQQQKQERSIQDRIVLVQKAVRKATEDALKKASFQQHQHQQQQQQQNEDITTTTRAGNSSSSSSNNASFLLGMDLFGQEVNALERGVREKLQDIEIELEQIIQLSTNTENININTTSTRNNNDSDIDMMDTTTNDDDGMLLSMSIEELQKQTKSLQFNIEFLKECSFARSLTDDAITLSSSALSAEPNFIEASTKLIQAGRKVDIANQLLQQHYNDNDNDNNDVIMYNNNDNPTTTTTSTTITALKIGYQILDSIRNSIRRQRVELITKATTLFQSSVTITSSTMSVRGSTQLEQAFHIFKVLSSSPSKDKDDDNHHDDGHPSLVSISSSALEDCIRNFTNTVMETIIEPILETHTNKTAPTTSWIINKTSDQLTKGLIGGVSSTSKDSVYRLEWHQKENDTSTMKKKTTTTTSSSNTSSIPTIEEGKEEDGEEEGQGGSIGEEQINHSSKIIDSWKVTLDLFEQIFLFVQSCILLEQESLCFMVGERLFGKPNALPSSLKVDALGLKSYVLGGDNGILMETLVESLTKTCIPKYVEPIQLDQLTNLGKKLLNFCVPFCRMLVENNFILFDKKKPPKLVSFCQHFEKYYVDNRRCVLLNDARHVLLKNDYHNTVIVGVDVTKHNQQMSTSNELGMDNGMAVFLLHKSSISDTSYKIMNLVRETMDEAVAVQHQRSIVGTTSTTTHHDNDEEDDDDDDDDDSPLSLLVPTLYRTAREMLSLFRSIIPASHGSEVAQVPRTAAVLHNDCVFLAHNCLTLGLEYKEKFPKPKEEDARGNLLKQTCMFVDMVPLFREMADRSMGDMLELQKNQIADIVGSRITYLGKALASDESLHEWSEAETAIAAGMYHLRHLSQAWKPILSTSVFQRSIQYLADVIFTLYLDQVTSIQTKAISASACHFCSALFTKAIEEINKLLDENEDNDDNDNNNKNKNKLMKTTKTIAKPSLSSSDIQQQQQRSHVWEHFVAIGQFMDMNLNDIITSLGNGVFRQVEGQELSRLIIATFDDSPKRQSVLDTLGSTST